MSTISNSVNRTIRVLMTSRNIIIMSCCLIATGYILMSGDGSTEKSFEPDIF